MSELFAALERAEALLSKRRFLAGDTLTEADIRLFVTLIRFDPVYVVYFKTDRKAIREFPALADYVRDVYQARSPLGPSCPPTRTRPDLLLLPVVQTPGIRESVSVLHIKRHYFTSHPRLNAFAIVPGGPEAWWEGAHGRHRMTKQPVAWSV